ncbi:MAG: MBL fold metallo-hydrolase [Kiritimatiellae bacterium]|nr:MBL fold metallo-hydrolase [Kiritimatiellia bacterium]MBQ6330069.1 MBL fold metallo-hydrolase [Kiritimatiellia bacterium]
MAENEMRRGEFLKCAAGVAAAGLCPTLHAEEDAIATWQRETDLVSADVYRSYLNDGDTRSLASLEKLEAAYAKVARELDETEVGDVPAVWSVYNMGYVVKTRKSTFAIDLVHRRDAELAPRLDFALITHNHADHWRGGLYRAMDRAGKTVISNFLDNYGAADWRKAGPAWKDNGGYTRARKTFRIKDVEVRTSLVDHNDYLIDFTTAFEIRVGDWLLYHTGDCGKGSEGKLVTTWGRPDLWLFFPGCGINVAEAVKKVQPKRVVFGHLWELGHSTGRLTEPLIRRALAAAKPICGQTAVAFWGDRVS